ncbi:MAG: bacteriocin fulvocin C-related protein [Bacteroidetes bacterium]|jgi:hypothetical protein|nr:bacteriocin fulvocin C-related protein [Bacteroidota bacterium]
MEYYKALLIMIVVVLLSNCNKKEPLCNPETDLDCWIEQNSSNFDNYTRADITKLPYDRYIAVYGSLSQQKRLDMWQEKLQLTANQNDLTDEQSKFILELKDYIANAWFGPTDVIVTYTEEWKKQGEELYGWTEEEYVIMLELLYTREELTILRDQISSRNVPGSSSSGGGGPKAASCQCRSDLACFLGGGDGCDDTTCNPTEDCCGILGRQPCLGRCI